jgi:hypothetical protein
MPPSARRKTDIGRIDPYALKISDAAPVRGRHPFLFQLFDSFLFFRKANTES